jgi:hypothetical protein
MFRRVQGERDSTNHTNMPPQLSPCLLRFMVAEADDLPNMPGLTERAAGCHAISTQHPATPGRSREFC